MYINKFNSPKSYDIDTIPDLPMKKLRQKEVKEFVQGQAANNCPKKKKNQSWLTLPTQQPPTTHWLQISTLQKEAPCTIIYRMKKNNWWKNSIPLGWNLSLQIPRWHHSDPIAQRRLRGFRGRLCEPTGPLSYQSLQIFFYFMNWRFPHFHLLKKILAIFKFKSAISLGVSEKKKKNSLFGFSSLKPVLWHLLPQGEPFLPAWLLYYTVKLLRSRIVSFLSLGPQPWA